MPFKKGQRFSYICKKHKQLSMKFINLFNVKNKIDNKTNLMEPLEIDAPKSLDIEEKNQTKSASKKRGAREIFWG